MATISYTVTYPAKGITEVLWSGLTENDDGAPFDTALFPDKTVQVSGSFGTGGSVDIEGTLDVAAPGYDILKDGSDNLLTILSASQHIDYIAERAMKIRPNVTAGTSVSLNVKLFLS